MAHTKSRTAQRREKASGLVQQRTIVLPLDLQPEQFDLLEQVAGLYNRMWSSLISWCDSNRTVNRTRMQKDNYRRLRDQYPQLPSQFVCVGHEGRGRGHALMELEPTQTQVEHEGQPQGHDHQL